MMNLKTTLAGIVAILSGTLYLIESLFAIAPVVIGTPAAAVAAVAAGIGLIFSRDAEKKEKK